MDCLLDLSLFKTKLALLMNLANPRGLSSCPPELPWPWELMFAGVDRQKMGIVVMQCFFKAPRKFECSRVTDLKMRPMTGSLSAPALDG